MGEAGAAVESKYFAPTLLIEGSCRATKPASTVSNKTPSSRSQYLTRSLSQEKIYAKYLVNEQM